MEIWFVAWLALIVLWLIVIVGWIAPLLFLIVFRTRRKVVRILGAVCGIWFAAACLAGAITFPLVHSTFVSIPRPISQKDLKPFADMYRVDRESYGLYPIDKTADIRLERQTRAGAKMCGYDAMLHFGGPVSRDISFVLENGRYRWIGEQEIHYSGRTYETADGQSRESLCIDYSSRQTHGMPTGLRIDYDGDDKRLMLHEWTIGEAHRVIDGWNSRTGSSSH